MGQIGPELDTLVALGVVWMCFSGRVFKRWRAARLATGVAAIAITLVLVASVVVKFVLTRKEAWVLAEVAEIIAAEEAYAAAHDGYYAEPICLAQPQDCSLPGTKPSLSKSLIPPKSLAPRGYHRAFFWTASHDKTRTRLQRFAYTAVPVIPGSRSFCADSSGHFCYSWDKPRVRDATCAEGCRPVKESAWEFAYNPFVKRD